MIANLTLTRPSDAAGSHRAGAVKAERHRITCELHDAASQALFAANLLAGTLAGTAGIEVTTRPASEPGPRPRRSASRSTASPSRRRPTSAATAGPATCTWAGPCARPAAGGVLAIRSAPGEGTELLLQVNWN